MPTLPNPDPFAVVSAGCQRPHHVQSDCVGRVFGTNTLCYDTEHHISSELPGEAVCNSVVILFISKPQAHFQCLRMLPLHDDALASHFKLLLPWRIEASCCFKAILKIRLKQRS